MKKPLVAMVALALLAAGCGGSSDSEELAQVRAELDALKEQIASTTVVPKTTVATTTTTTQAPATTVAPTTTTALPTPAEVFATVSPSVVFIEVPDGTGSGVLLSSGYVVTNAHVVGHSPTVRLFTSAGELAEVPVHAKDWLTDLALIGPVPLDELGGVIPAVNFGSSATVAIADDVYLIGYPGELETHPEPAVTSGTLSRRRLAPCLGMTFLQTDAVIAGGQSGGALVDSAGQLIGISGLGGFTESNFALVLTAEDALAALAALDAGSGNLLRAEGSAGLRQSYPVANVDSAGYLVTITEEQSLLSLTAYSPVDEDVWLKVDTWDGYVPWWYWPQDEVDYIWDDIYAPDEEDADVFYADAFDDGTAESLEVSLAPGAYVVSVGHFLGTPTVISVEASSPLTPLEDAEPPGGVLSLGKSVTGALNHIEDIDNYQIDLQNGSTVRIRMASVSDSVMSLYLDGWLVASNDDAGIGLYGDGAEIVFEVKETGRYDLDVAVWDITPGVYVLTLDLADTDSPVC